MNIVIFTFMETLAFSVLGYNLFRSKKLIVVIIGNISEKSMIKNVTSLLVTC